MTALEKNTVKQQAHVSLPKGSIYYIPKARFRAVFYCDTDRSAEYAHSGVTARKDCCGWLMEECELIASVLTYDCSLSRAGNVTITAGGIDS